jgi:acyl-coenzyme A thioesterase PaaI-like protein
MSRRAFQDDFAEIGIHECWGCGARNEQGLRIKSYWSDTANEALCTWQPQPYHVAGAGAVNGGIIAAILDCHCTCTAIADAYRVEERAIVTPPMLLAMTASLHITYLRPTPVTEPLFLRAWVTQRTERKTLLSCTLLAAGEERARADAVIVRVPAFRLALVDPRG